MLVVGMGKNVKRLVMRFQDILLMEWDFITKNAGKMGFGPLHDPPRRSCELAW